MTETKKHRVRQLQVLDSEYPECLDGCRAQYSIINADTKENVAFIFDKKWADLFVTVPDLRRENAELKEIKKKLVEVLEMYEKAEADIVLNANWNTLSGVPQITQEQFDRLVECQTIKASALRKARGEEE